VSRFPSGKPDYTWAKSLARQHGQPSQKS